MMAPYLFRQAVQKCNTVYSIVQTLKQLFKTITPKQSYQEAQLSQRDRAMLRVTEYIAKSLTGILLLLCLNIVQFLRYSASKNGVALKSMLGVVLGY